MSYLDWREAFDIFAKYDPEGGEVSAAHDEMWAGPNPEDVSAEDRKRLEELGWTESTEHYCFHTFV